MNRVMMEKCYSKLSKVSLQDAESFRAVALELLRLQKETWDIYGRHFPSASLKDKPKAAPLPAPARGSR